ncbi:MAG: helix-hairpin-helix domain-containing protein [Sinobacterium sp.]|nr:helix-hairpin-helix domain-containing protein [Sinobacterium sp.]
MFKSAVKQIMKGAAILAVSASAFAGPVNINSADAATLAKELSGVGSKRAEAIVAYREENGEFKGVEDLEKVKGVGEATLKANAGNILLK